MNGMFGTCAECGTTCVQVYLVERDAESGVCAPCLCRHAAREQLALIVAHALV
jgi:hypothetical protein